MCLYYKKRRKKRFAIILLLAVTLMTAAVLFAEKRISQIVKQMARQNVKASVAMIVNKTVFDELKQSGITYDTLVHLEKDEDGKVTALETDIIQVNSLKSKLSMKILDKLKNSKSMKLKIPVGTIFGGELTSGRGPAVKVKFMPIGTVEADVYNNVSSCGINQTRHQIELKVNVHVTIITALRNTSADITTNVCIAETVIVGNVPETYTEIDAHTGMGEPDTDIALEPDDIFNFIY